LSGRTRVSAWDLARGRKLWIEKGFGTWLSYSEQYDVLVEAGLMARDTLWDEAKGMRGYRGKDGGVLWDRPDYFGPALIRGSEVLKSGDARAGSGSACALLTGKPILRPDPLTGKPAAWSWTRSYGCNTPAAAQHLVTFRSGAAGFYDLCGEGGTGNLGGFRSSCTNNLIVAGGVLTAPDYTRTCTCSYQNQTSLGLVHMPQAELWTFQGKRPVGGPVRRVGLLLGAPGNRRAEDGTLWLEYPRAGGPSPQLGVTCEPRTPTLFRVHSALVEGDGRTWVVASGARGLRRLSVALSGDSPGSLSPRRYTVRLHFREPDGLPAGQRRFDVLLQGRLAEVGLDVSKLAGGPNRALVREYVGVSVTRDLTITLKPDLSAPVPVPVLCGVEVTAEGW
jgi:hypothetical protein